MNLWELCDFKTIKDEMIRDQFIKKTIHHRIRERSLLEAYSLDQTIETIRRMENVTKEAKLLWTRGSFCEKS